MRSLIRARIVMDSRRPLQLSFGFALLLALVALTAGLSRPAPAHGATFVVASTTDAYDVTPGNGVCQGVLGFPCSLRAAIQEANALAGPDVITLPAGTYNLTRSGAGEDSASTGDLDITSDITINGAGAGTTIIDAGELDRVFHVLSGTVSISGVTIRNGHVSSGGVIGSDRGGGIYNLGTLTLTNGTVSGNLGDNGGGITNSGTLTLTNSTVTGNEASSSGGGIFNSGAFALADSTVSGNIAGSGGAIRNDLGTLTLTNSTVSGNMAYISGGGFYNRGTWLLTLTLTNSTITNNTADRDASGTGDGGGIASSGDTAVNLKNTIVAGNFDLSSVDVEPECIGALNSQGYNLIQTVSPGCAITGDATGNVTGQGANLTPLASNGGPTQTHAILAGSPAIDAGSPDCPPPATDQRGVGRPLGSGCDIGAYESSFTCADDDSDGICNSADNCPTTENAAQLNDDADPLGNACDNCPVTTNPDQADQDGDEFGDACEQPNCVTIPNYWNVPTGDGDCDGFTDTNEGQVSTDPNLPCHSTGVNVSPPGTNDEPLPDRWPVDFNDNQIVNTIDVGFYVPRLNAVDGEDPEYDIRYDLSFNGVINTIDVGRFVPFLNKSCTP